MSTFPRLTFTSVSIFSVVSIALAPQRSFKMQIFPLCTPTTPIPLGVNDFYGQKSSIREWKGRAQRNGVAHLMLGGQGLGLSSSPPPHRESKEVPGIGIRRKRGKLPEGILNSHPLLPHSIVWGPADIPAVAESALCVRLGL